MRLTYLLRYRALTEEYAAKAAAKAAASGQAQSAEVHVPRSAKRKLRQAAVEARWEQSRRLEPEPGDMGIVSV